MIVKKCPLFPQPFYKYTVDLSNETFTLSFRWNGRLEQWLMSIEDAEGKIIARGIALVPLYPLTDQLSLESPVGDFILVPVERTSPSIPIPREIYKTHKLVYVTD
jgi:hypothetical protein